MKINNVKPRQVVVTGAGSGIGRATAIKFAELGAHVVASDIEADAAAATAATIRADGHRASSAHLDVTDTDEWEVFAGTILDEYGPTDVLVNNAGMLVNGPFLELTPAHWDRQLGVNLFGMVNGCRTFGRQMADNKVRGHIVNIASAAAFTPTPVMSAYSVSKAGVKMLTECLRLEFRSKGIGVSAVCPGVINTNIGENGLTVGLDEATIQYNKDRNRKMKETFAKLPFTPLSPNLVARAAVRAVRYDLAVVPVRSEAWLGYFLQRIAPGANRNLLAPMTFDRLNKRVASS